MRMIQSLGYIPVIHYMRNMMPLSGHKLIALVILVINASMKQIYGAFIVSKLRVEG